VTRLLLLFCLLLTACSENSQPEPPVMEVPAALLVAEDEIRAGAELFSRHCSECHGTAAEGRTGRAARFNPPAPDFLAADYAEEAPAYLFWRIETGKHIEPFYSQGSVMPAFGAYFSERQIWQLVAYLRNRAKRSTSAAQESDRTFS